jgi:hypothetical protein
MFESSIEGRSILDIKIRFITLIMFEQIVNGNASSGAMKVRIFRASVYYIYAGRIGIESEKHVLIVKLTLST